MTPRLAHQYLLTTPIRHADYFNKGSGFTCRSEVCIIYAFAIIACRDLSFAVWFQALSLFERKDLANLVDPALRDQCSQACLHYAFLTASLCVRESPHMRPDMRDVVASLTRISASRSRRRLDRGGPSTTRTSSDENHHGSWETQCKAKQRSSSVATFCGDGQLPPVWEQESCSPFSNDIVGLQESSWSWWGILFNIVR